VVFSFNRNHARALTAASGTAARLRTVLGLVALGLFIYAWLGLADAATGGCDDGCGGPGWEEDPRAHQWEDQRRVAFVGVGFTLLATVFWLLRLRRLALVPAAVALVLFVHWYGVAEEARFGPPDIGSTSAYAWSRDEPDQPPVGLAQPSRTKAPQVERLRR
jgi:hypothetical protein